MAAALSSTTVGSKRFLEMAEQNAIQAKKPRTRKMPARYEGFVFTDPISFHPPIPDIDPMVTEKPSASTARPLKNFDPTFFDLYQIQVPVTFTAQVHIDRGCKRKVERCWSRLNPDLIADPENPESRRCIACIDGSKESGIDAWTQKYTVRWINDEIGHGLFAKAPYKKNEVIGCYAGVLTSKVKNQEYSFEWPDSPYAEEDLAIDGFHMGNATRFMNHAPEKIDKRVNRSCNVSSVEFFHDGMPHIIFIARRPIETGEQLCYDYGESYWEKKGYEPTVL